MDDVPMKIERFTYDIIYYLLWIIEIILFLRFIMKILGANQGNQVVGFLYSLSAVIIGPFNGIFPAFTINTMVFEPSTLIAMVFYAIVAYLLIAFLKMINQNHRDI